MALTSQQTVQNLIDRANKLGDPMLAADIRAFAQQREFGLVFEHNRPERMRLYGRKVGKGDVVQVLPPRGQKEDASSQLLWLVSNIHDDIADLTPFSSISYNENTGGSITVELSELVAIAEYDEPIYAGLRETGRVGRGGDKPYQVVINGENYHALEALTFAYAGKVDCIYIDPPYNTGARDWKYNNDYVDGNDTYRHSKWLAMMERRLKLAKQLLNPENSVMVVTIDEKEHARLTLLLEQVFPEATGIQTVSITINKNGIARNNQFKRADEYAIFLFFGKAAPTRQDQSLFSVEFNSDNKSTRKKKVRWEWLMRGGPNAPRKRSPNLFYPIYIDEETKQIKEIGPSLSISDDWRTFPVPKGLRAIYPLRPDGREATWRISGKALQAKIDRGCARVGEYDSLNDRYAILYLGDIQEERIKSGEIKVAGKRDDGSLIVEMVGDLKTFPTTVWSGVQFSAGEYGSRYIKKFLGERQFTFPKSLYAVELTLASYLSDKPDALVLDFFSGSGTTAHATMRLNHLDSGNRQCICVTNNELSEPEEKRLTKQLLRKGDPEWESLGICEYITKPRIKAAITGLTPDGEPIKGDYKFIDEFPMSDGFEENAVFFDLTYQNPLLVEYGAAFHEIAPLLWLRAGSIGSIIEEETGSFAFADTYGILFNYSYVQEFMDAVQQHEGIRCLYVITDDATRYANVAKEFPDLDVVRLYESYLQSFKIAAEGCE